MSTGESGFGLRCHRAARVRACRLWLASLLLVALPLVGPSGVLAHLLGTTHVHRPAAVSSDPLEGWQDLRRVVGGGTAARATHDHALWMKHRHGPVDASVVALGLAGPGSASTGAAPSLMASIVLHAPALLELGLHAAEPSPLRWAREPPRRFESTVFAPPERPPKT